MKRSLLLLASVATVALSGCSNEEIANVETSTRNAIGFNVVGNNGSSIVSRATTPITPTNFTDFNFTVLAFYSGTGNCYMGNNYVDDSGHKGIEITHQDNQWNYKNEAQKHYWPTVNKPLDFYAAAPANIPLARADWAIGTGTATITYSNGENWNHDDYDLMLAITPNQTKDSNKGKVKLQFKHLLSQVIFKAKNEKTYLKVEVNKITVHNVHMNGIYTIPSNINNWQPDSNHWLGTASPGEHPVEIIKDFSLNDVTSIKDLSNEPLMLIPQKVVKWDMTHDISKADEHKEGYLTIECKIKNTDPTMGGIYLVGKENEWGTIYVPFTSGMKGEDTISWEPGYRYIYTLVFTNGGFDTEGKPMLTPILFDPAVEKWEDKESDLATSFPDRETE